MSTTNSNTRGYIHQEVNLQVFHLCLVFVPFWSFQLTRKKRKLRRKTLLGFHFSNKAGLTLTSTKTTSSNGRGNPLQSKTWTFGRLVISPSPWLHSALSELSKSFWKLWWFTRATGHDSVHTCKKCYTVIFCCLVRVEPTNYSLSLYTVVTFNKDKEKELGFLTFMWD